MTDSAFPGQFEDRVGTVSGPNKHLDVPAAEVAICAARRHAVSATRGYRPQQATTAWMTPLPEIAGHQFRGEVFRDLLYVRVR